VTAIGIAGRTSRTCVSAQLHLVLLVEYSRSSAENREPPDANAGSKEHRIMRNLSTPTRFGMLALCLAAVVATVSPAAAQTSASGKWGFEFHTGGVLPTNPTAGTASLPSAGQPFATAAMYPPPAPPVITVASSRRESSWYFGDGAILFNQAA